MSGHIRTGNKRAEAHEGVKPEMDEVQVNIDRGNSILANHYKISTSMTRNQAISYYRSDLEMDIRLKGPMHAELVRIADLLRSGQNVILMCWCAPMRCHGDVVAEHVKKIIARHEVESNAL